jgi:hypothetical protein
MGWLRRHYGAGPVHLVAVLGCFAFSGYVISRIYEQSGLIRILLWFLLALVAHDLILWPLYTLADRRLLRAARHRTPRVPWVNHVRAPAVISGILLGITFPLVLRANADYYRELTGTSADPYLWHWLLITLVLFGASGLIYAARLFTAGRRSDAPGPPR